MLACQQNHAMLVFRQFVQGLVERHGYNKLRGFAVDNSSGPGTDKAADWKMVLTDSILTIVSTYIDERSVWIIGQRLGLTGLTGEHMLFEWKRRLGRKATPKRLLGLLENCRKVCELDMVNIRKELNACLQKID